MIVVNLSYFGRGCLIETQQLETLSLMAFYPNVHVNEALGGSHDKGMMIMRSLEGTKENHGGS